MRFIRHATLLALLAIFSADELRASDDNGALLSAMARLVTDLPPSAPLNAELRGETLIYLGGFGDAARADLMSQGGDPCVLVHLRVNQKSGGWAQSSIQIYDFRKIDSAQFLSVLNEVRPDDDPVGTTLRLEGAGWRSHRVAHIDPAKPAFDHVSLDTLNIIGIGLDGRPAILDALSAVRGSCFSDR